MKTWDTRKHQQILKYKKDKQKWDKQLAEYFKSVREAIDCPTASKFNSQEIKRSENDTFMKGQ